METGLTQEGDARELHPARSSVGVRRGGARLERFGHSRSRPVRRRLRTKPSRPPSRRFLARPTSSSRRLHVHRRRLHASDAGVATAAVRRNAETRSAPGAPRRAGGGEPDPKALFAKLINAKPTEISYIPTRARARTSSSRASASTQVRRQRRHRRAALRRRARAPDGAAEAGPRPAHREAGKDCRIDMSDLEKVVDQEHEARRGVARRRCTTASSTT